MKNEMMYEMKLLMAAILISAKVSVWADPVAKVGETEYETLDAAVAAGGEIRLVADATVDCLIVEEGDSVTLDLAGHTLTGTRSDRATIFVKGSLTIDDSAGDGRITHEGEVAYSGHTASSASAIANNGELVLLGGVICDCEGDTATVANRGSFYMSGGSISNCTGTVCGGVQNYGDFVMAGGAIEDCRGRYGAIANNGGHNNVSATMLMTGGLITRCYSTEDVWVVYGAFSLTIVDGIFDDCGERTLGGARLADTIVITGGRFAGGIPTGASGNAATITGGVFSQSVYESVIWNRVLSLGYACVANTDDLTARDYPWTVERVFSPIAPGETVKGIVAADEAAALAAVRVSITDRNALSTNQERLIRKIAVLEADGTWTVSLELDTTAEGYVDPKVTLAAVVEQLNKIAQTTSARQTDITLPANVLTVGLYYWIEESSDLGGEWTKIGCQIAKGAGLTYYLYGADGQSRFFRIGQSLTQYYEGERVR